ncbi:MAG TPA: histidine phosphatase family protein [Kofleriaceae bacterium]
MSQVVVHLVRHGEVHNPENIKYGRIPGFRLSERGRAQAAAAGARLRELGVSAGDALVASPLERAVETATLVGAETGQGAPATDERVIEATSRFDGISRYAPAWPWKWWLFYNPFRPSWGEPFTQIQARMRSAIEETRARGPRGVIVAHQGVIWIARHSYTRGGPPWCSRVRTDKASITTLHFDGDKVVADDYWVPSV